MVYKHPSTGIRIEVEKKDSTTWTYHDPVTGNKVSGTRHQLLKDGYKYSKAESKLKRFDGLKMNYSKGCLTEK
jgi:hypothetical protein